MPEQGRAGARRPGGRRAGKSGTRGAILGAARRLFATDGADGTSIRAVAQAAAVDPALVLHYFGSKDGLLQAAMEWPVDMNVAADRIFRGGVDGLGERLVRFFMEQWEDETTRHPLEIIIRGAMRRESEGRLLTEFAHDQLIGRLAAILPGPDADLRASLVLSSLLGLAIARYVLKVPPLAAQSVDEVTAMVAPTIQRYLGQDLGRSALRSGLAP
jgi:AcrR family transcriptional regulator